jgi:hypothetical protein
MANPIVKNANFNKLKDYLRVRPGTDISINTPILNINIGFSLLKRTDARDPIYDVDIRRIRTILKKKFHHLFENPDHIDDYVAVGQVDRRYRGDVDSSTDPNLSIILANTRVIPTTKQYRRIRNNVWIAETKLGGTKMRSIGTIYSRDKPEFTTPVFPVAYLKKVSDSEPNYDVYSDRAYGRHTLNDTALNIDKRNMRMIDSTGDISLIPSNTFVPMTPDELYSADMTGIDLKFNRKVYFTAQGNISNDSNCVMPRDNMTKMHMMECNGIATTTNVENMANIGSDDLSLNARVDENVSGSGISNKSKIENYSNIMTPPDNTNHRILTDREKKIILREKDEPWFTDPNIVGDIADYDNPHTITGHHDTLEMTDSELYDIIDELKPKGSLGALKGDSETLVLIGTFDGDTDEVNMPFASDCAQEPVIGYSRYDKLQKCLNNENRNGMGRLLENFDGSNSEPNYNNYIMWVICLVIVALLIYKWRQ